MRFKLPEPIYIVSKNLEASMEAGRRFCMRRDDWVHVSQFERLEGLSGDIRVFVVEWPSYEFRQKFSLSEFTVEKYL